MSGGNSNGADRSRGEAERAQRERPREEASGRSDARSDDTRAPRADASTAGGRAQRGAAREREGAFGNAVITAEVCYFLVTKHYRMGPAGFEPEPEGPARFTARAASGRVQIRQVTLATAHCRSQDEWALPDLNRRPPGIPFRGRAARLLLTEI